MPPGRTTAMHPRNPHRAGYDFAALTAASPPLAPFVRTAPHGGPTIDFADPAAVKALNGALLVHHYGVHAWDLPPGYLCPPVPGRADYVHAVADLLATTNGGAIPQGAGVRVLDVGVGANLIFPLLGHHAYGWSFVGTEVDAAALRHADALLAANPRFASAVSLRRQRARDRVFADVVGADEHFALTLCNPPFHISPGAAAAATGRKLRQLGGGTPPRLRRNFGGTSSELWCAGGELGFIRRMIDESRSLATQVGWFTTLVSSREHLPPLERALDRAGATDVRVLPLEHGQKKSRILAWRFTRPDRAPRVLPRTTRATR